MPLSVCFSHSGSRRESRLTSARIRPWYVSLTSKAAVYFNQCRFVVVGSLKHDLPKLRELRVLIRLLEWHWRLSLTGLNLQLRFLPGPVETEADAHDAILRLREV